MIDLTELAPVSLLDCYRCFVSHAVRITVCLLEVAVLGPNVTV